MPSRYSRLDDDDDDERLPAGMARVGYDADTQVYTFRDASDGSYWEAAPGCRYGQLTRVSGPSPPLRRAYADDDGHDALGPSEPPPAAARPHISWRHDLMPLLNFGLLVGLSLLLLFWFLHRAADDDAAPARPLCAPADAPIVVASGDTCWALAEARAIDLQHLLARNPDLDCSRLVVGSTLCLPK